MQLVEVNKDTYYMCVCVCVCVCARARLFRHNLGDSDHPLGQSGGKKICLEATNSGRVTSRRHTALAVS